MKNISRYFTFVYAMLLCMPSFAQDKAKYVELSRLRDMLTGEFRSGGEVQLKQGKDIVLLKSKPIWHDRTDGYWVYVEQFPLSDDKNPVVQTVLHFYRSGNQAIVCQPYELKEPSQYAGATNQQSILRKISYTDLKKGELCGIDFQKQAGDGFIGKTTEAYCNDMIKANENNGIEWSVTINEFNVRLQSANQQKAQSFLPDLIAAKYQRELPE